MMDKQYRFLFYLLDEGELTAFRYSFDQLSELQQVEFIEFSDKITNDVRVASFYKGHKDQFISMITYNYPHLLKPTLQLQH